MKKKSVSNKSLFGEYISRWYILILTVIFSIIGYMVLPFVSSFIATRGLSAFWSGILGIVAGGFVATLPLLIINIKLAKQGRYYALAVQFILFDILGTAFYLINQIGLNS